MTVQSWDFRLEHLQNYLELYISKHPTSSRLLVTHIIEPKFTLLLFDSTKFVTGPLLVDQSEQICVFGFSTLS